ncbi:MAG: hypothetical protein KBD78_07385, partial [Oligoflexales bacterium]|nr:hypothetical protein [Oligoflexales bacterium]
SYLGITPIAAVSTVDDDDVSGGVSRVVLPQKQSEDNSQQNNTASNSDQTNVGNKTSEKEPKIKIENLPNENIDNSDDFTYIAKESIIGMQMQNQTAQCR